MEDQNKYPTTAKFGDIENLASMEQDRVGSMMEYAYQEGGDTLKLAQAIADNQLLYVKCAHNDWCVSKLQYYNVGTLADEAVLVFTSWKINIIFEY